MREGTKRLIVEDLRDTQVTKRGQPLHDLPTIEGEIAAPRRVVDR